jgi:alkanesulfonate monooxygenase SsuD/methylene tetrahydromethanopterin reductase-like flavin-dependent oxidoreductase (luciferase family)
VEAPGLAFESPAVRKAHLPEAVEILRRLLDGHEVTFSGKGYQLDQVGTLPARQEHVPFGAPT